MLKISNILSLLRLLLSIPLAYLLWNDMLAGFFGLGAVAFFTDYLDGYFARKMNEISDIGKIIDPLADKVILGAVTIVLILQHKLPIWLAIAIIARDLLILAGGLLIKKKYGTILGSNKFGKLTVNVYSAEFILLILNVSVAFNYGIWITFIFAVVSFILYIFDMFKFIRTIKT